MIPPPTREPGEDLAAWARRLDHWNSAEARRGLLVSFAIVGIVAAYMLGSIIYLTVTDNPATHRCIAYEGGEE